ncbi:tetratricopeptide repeat protein [Stenotrophomonas maltophilia]|uniref:tetratricopeptide repeat protein n=1 Tax=Stenotrophomonas maltophilia TaxID=40324 RepID=UPI00131235DB|nr:tetratricopeptide repeat protein [Stenotrophomonas maltophilia]MDZ5784961.1 tetratricopeptide repeat protein [Stenotrophomonas maltophilia]HDS1552677.1 tetratricopeptide repeat protein [Stenotrophomonas maltophilia]
MKMSLPPRRLIPRWRRMSATLEQREAGGKSGRAATPFTLDEERFSATVDNWSVNKTSGSLGDLLTFAADPELKPKVIDIVRKAIRDGFELGPVQQSFFARMAEHEDKSSPSGTLSNQQRVADLRSILRANPENPLALLDLAQHQVSTGNGLRAERTVKTALSLSPNSRLVLRTLARLNVHLDKSDKKTEKVSDALRLIGKHERTPFDPWLMATEIALSEVAGVDSKFASKGVKFLKDGKASAADLSELACAIGSLELKSGNLKRAREFFRLALLQPNDNVLAQAVTEQRQLGIEIASSSTQRNAVIVAQEAQTLLAWNSLRVEDAQEHASLWHDEEPFSSRPLHFLTTLYAVQCDYAKAEKFARQGLVADPNDAGLLTNLSYALANSGHYEEARATLRRLLRIAPAKYEPIALATYGLIAMKQGDFEAGDRFYTTAMSDFRCRRDSSLEAICFAYYARAAKDTSHPNRVGIENSAKDMYRSHPTADSALVLRRLGSEVSPPDIDVGMRKLTSWIFDEETNSLIPKHGVGGAGAPLLTVRKK